jgi:hypothetical protein
MLDFIIFLLSTIGATLIITQSYILKPLRKKILKINNFFGKLLHCSQCCGFWVAMIIETLLLIYHNQFDLNSLIIIILYGFIGSFISYLTYLLIRPLMDKYD